jgi:hypothetical protein
VAAINTEVRGARRRRSWRVGLVAGVVGLAFAASVPLVWAASSGTGAAQAGEVSFWPSGQTVGGSAVGDDQAVELGLQFSSSVAGSLTGVRFYKPQQEQGAHAGSVWDDAGHLLAQANFTGESASGWQEVRFGTAVPVTAGRKYTVSYHTDHGSYWAEPNAFDGKTVTSGPLTALNGVYVYGASGYPTQTFHSTNYYVDVLFRPATTSSPTPSATPTPSPSAPAGGFPSAANTGVPSGTTLTKQTGNLVIRQDGTVIDAVDLTGSIDVYANNVTIRRSKISGTNWWGVYLREGYANLTVEDSEIFGNGVQQMEYGISSSGGTVTALRNNVHTISNGIDVPIGLIEDNYVHDPKYFDGDHTDMIMSEGGAPAGSTLTIRHNTAVNTLDQTGAIALFADWGPQHDVQVENNLLIGGGYSFYGGDVGSSNLHVTGNVFGREVWPNGGHWGPIAHWDETGPGNVFQNNTWEDGGTVTP